ncbi:MAG TPA: hypothetical protein VM222_00570 [Planctomycetota bacterium]|nr:hypothetical protein [Planctomycetota bacterium]
MNQRPSSRAGSFAAFAAFCAIALHASAAFAQDPRTPRAATGGSPISVTVTVNISEGNATYDPATLPEDKHPDLKALAEGYAAQFKAAEPNFFQGFRERDFVREMLGGLRDIQRGTGEDAFHLPGLPIFTAFNVTSVNSETDGLGGVVEIVSHGISVRVLPSDADQTLTDHENGHREIFKYYYKTVQAQYLQKEILRVISAKHYATIAALQAEVRTLATTLAPAFVTAVGDQNDYQDVKPASYDVATDHGQLGDQNAEAQKVRDAILAKAKATYPADF